MTDDEWFPDEECAKCGGTDLNVRWHRKVKVRSFRKGCGEEEHLHYTCRRCSYSWTGPTKEQAEAS